MSIRGAGWVAGGEVMGDRVVRAWARIAAAHEGDLPVSVAAVCRAAVRWLDIDGASVTVVSGQVARELLFASDELSGRLEDLLFTTGEGPGVTTGERLGADGFSFGSPTLVPDLAAVAGRWPGFVSAALDAGAGAMFVFPLQAGAIGVGVLSLYRAQPGSLTPGELADVLVFAGIALQMVLDGAAGISSSPDYRPLDDLSEGRAEVYQATGMVSVQLGVDLQEAFVRLRAHAFAASAGLSDVAGDVVNRKLRFHPDRP
jgi:hypothetical protein